MTSQIEIYQEICGLSAQMVAAAKEQDWDRLVILEQSVSSLRDSLAADDNARLAPDTASLKAQLIQRILDDDAEVRRHTEPWMEHVRQFLGGASTRRRVESAYNAMGGAFGGSLR